MILTLVMLLLGPPRPGFLADTVMYLSPIDPNLYISSTFAETRGAHFHAAIDFGTFGKTGYPVFASRAGVVHRVLISPNGYGFAIFLRHADGSFTQYSHLREFSRKISSAIDSIRISEGIYLFDRVVESLGIRVKAGEVIALSGDTGAGPPHLHFEVRSPQNRALNPFLVGFDMPDRIAPQFQGIAFEPLDIRTTIQGRRQIVTAGVQADGTDYRFNPVTVTGPVGLGVRVSDRSDHLRNVFAVYRLQLRVNGELVFTSQADSFALQDHGMMLLDRIYPLLGAGNRNAFQRLHLHDGNTTPFYTLRGNGGKLDLPPGQHDIRITAEDFAGNRAELNGRIHVETKGRPLPRGAVLSGHRVPEHATGASVTLLPTWIEPFHNWIVFKRKSDSLWTSEPSTFHPTVSAGDALPLNGDMTIGDVRLHRLIPTQERHFTTPDSRMMVTVPRNAVYDTLSFAFGYRMEAVEPALTVWQPLEPFRRPIRIGFEHDGNRHAGIYTASNQFVGSSLSDGYLTAWISSPGTFRIRTDSLPPVVSNPRISRRGSDWILSVTVRDDASGVNWHSAEIRVNGVRGMPETDMGARLTFLMPGWRPTAVNDVNVRIRDRMGNQADVSFRVNRP